MILHFQYKPLFSNQHIPGWTISFYFKKKRYTGTYHQTGAIEWMNEAPEQEDLEVVTSQIHELMLYHVYD
ncbi:YheE family protein [Neobacillus drentensis]|uniref:YheE family protein n=1 Tax=Neobacillus drentensis TaxID=220684 RepID=UPI001F27320A|nr:YheE family protein [Neobacillus drentensis]ULT58053.1 YheE family protein [Neobacillus drentensis]